MVNKISVGLIGAGAMGGGLLQNWISQDTIDLASSAVFEPSLNAKMTGLAKEAGVNINPPLDQFDFGILVAAIKPNQSEVVLPEYKKVSSHCVFLSVMAGRSIESIKKDLGTSHTIIRAMPNLPISIGKGMTGLFADDVATKTDQTNAETLMNAGGECVWVETEFALDFVTAVSGSGPAYYFLLTEALADAAASMGLSIDVAKKIARQTAIGSGAYLDQNSGDVVDHRKSVTSKGGTTAAALDILDGDDQALKKIMQKAIENAVQRAKDLST